MSTALKELYRTMLSLNRLEVFQAGNRIEIRSKKESYVEVIDKFYIDGKKLKHCIYIPSLDTHALSNNCICANTCKIEEELNEISTKTPI